MAKPWFPMYPGDYLRDTQHLTTEQHGAYVLLIMNYFTLGRALPNNDEYLRSVAKLSKYRWAKCKNILEKFFQKDENSWTHLRIEKELGRQQKTKQLRREAGLKGNISQGKILRNSDASATHLRVQPQPQPQSDKEEPPLNPPKGKKRRKPIAIDDIQIPTQHDNEIGRAAIGDWLEYKQGRGESYKTAKFFQRKLAEFATADLLAAAVDHSAGSGYSGLVPGRSGNGAKQTGYEKPKTLRQRNREQAAQWFNLGEEDDDERRGEGAIDVPFRALPNVGAD